MTEKFSTRLRSTLLLALIISFPVSANNPVTKYGAEYIDAVSPYVFTGNISRLPVKRPWQPGDPIKEIPKRRKTPSGPLIPNPLVAQQDPLLKIQQSASQNRSQRAISSATLNIDGQGFNGTNPPDTNGDVGIDYYIQMVNSTGGSALTIYNKSDGSVTAGPITLDSLGAGNCAFGLGDPIVLYDSLASRWLMSEFSDTANRLCVYVSQTSSPFGAWNGYEFTTPNFPDYPKYSVWHDAYYVTSNESTPAVYALDRINMLAGNAASLQRFTAPSLAAFGFNTLTPADIDGSMPPPAGSPAYFMRHKDDEVHNPGTNNASNDILEIWTFDVDFVTPANSSFTGPVDIPVSEFDSTLCGTTSFQCIPQPGSSVTLDPLREVVMWRLVYRNFGTHETLLGNFAIDVNGANRGGIRWYELRKMGSNWVLHQEGTYSPDAIHRWMGALAMDRKGNIALGYNVSDGSSTFPGIRYTGRRANDTPGVMTQAEKTLVAGTAANASNRYGDYSAMSVDPSDDCQFWFTGQYNPASSWSTRIGRFKFDTCRIKPTADVTCSGMNVLIQNRSFAVDTLCEGDNFVNLNTNIDVSAGASLYIDTPKAVIGPDFKVEAGSSLFINH